MVRASAPKLGPAQRKMWLQILQQHVASSETSAGKTRYRVVIDTNVWVSAILFGGLPEVLVGQVMNHHELVCSELITDEIVEYVRGVSPKVPRRWIVQLRKNLEQYVVPIDVEQLQGMRDLKDEPILALALATNAVIVTGDKDFLEHKGDLGVAVMTVAEAVQLL